MFRHETAPRASLLARRTRRADVAEAVSTELARAGVGHLLRTLQRPPRGRAVHAPPRVSRAVRAGA